MHYRNGREAKNGDKIVKIAPNGNIEAFGVLHSAVPGNDYCNGYIAVIQSPTDYACMVDCLHVVERLRFHVRLADPEREQQPARPARTSRRGTPCSSNCV